MANVRKKPDGEYVYSIQLKKSKREAPAPLLRFTSGSDKRAGLPLNRVLTDASADSIYGSDENVNTEKAEKEKIFQLVRKTNGMTQQLTSAGIPFAVNSDTKFYDRKSNEWIPKMMPVFDCIYS